MENLRGNISTYSDAFLGDENDHRGYEPRIRPSWDDPPSIPWLDVPGS